MKEECRLLENVDDKFSQYIHEYWLPWLDEQRKAGNLRKGKSIQESETTFPDEK